MTTDRATRASAGAQTGWTESDERFFTLVAEVLSTDFLWGAATLLASYDPDDAPVTPAPQRHTRRVATVPNQRSLAG
jgi:hypothetical protein